MDNRERTFVIGHSIVHRFNEFLEDDRDDRYLHGLGLSATHDITFKGVGGMLATEVLRRESRFIREFGQHMVILLVGGNLSFTKHIKYSCSFDRHLLSVLHI